MIGRTRRQVVGVLAALALGAVLSVATGAPAYSSPAPAANADAGAPPEAGPLAAAGDAGADDGRPPAHTASAIPGDGGAPARAGAKKAGPPEPLLYRQWWFWAVVGGVLVASAALIVSTRMSDVPSTDLGNKRAF